MTAYPARHIAARAMLAAVAGRLRFYRLSTPVLEQLRGIALQTAHGRKDTDPTLWVTLSVLREVDATLTRRARLDAEARARQAAKPAARTTPASSAGGAKVPVGPPPPPPLPPARLYEPEGAL